jgi:hypothetical protein
MHTYEFRFVETNEGAAVDRLQFDGRDASKALSIARDHLRGRQADLWEDGRKLCRLSRVPLGHGEVWVVNGGPRSLGGY